MVFGLFVHLMCKKKTDHCQWCLKNYKFNFTRKVGKFVCCSAWMKTDSNTVRARVYRGNRLTYGRAIASGLARLLFLLLLVAPSCSIERDNKMLARAAGHGCVMKLNCFSLRLIACGSSLLLVVSHVYANTHKGKQPHCLEAVSCFIVALNSIVCRAWQRTTTPSVAQTTALFFYIQYTNNKPKLWDYGKTWIKNRTSCLFDHTVLQR